MTAGRRYLVGLIVVAMIGAALVTVLPSSIRTEVAWAILLGLLVQAPLGWWTIRSIATGRFQLIWAAGMAIRLSVVFATGLVVVPTLGWQMGPALGALSVSLAVLLLVEVTTALREHSGVKGR